MRQRIGNWRVCVWLCQQVQGKDLCLALLQVKKGVTHESSGLHEKEWTVNHMEKSVLPEPISWSTKEWGDFRKQNIGGTS